LPRLQVLNGKRQGATYEIGRGGAVVGHRNTAPITIDDPWVSWDHARIFLQSDSFWIEDLGSTNGTFVNCVRVKRERLSHEDIIFFGKTHVIFLVPETAPISSGDDQNAAPKKDERGRSSFEVNVEAVAAAAQWPSPAPQLAPTQASPSVKNGQNGWATPAGAALPDAPTGVGEDSSRSRRDPFRPGADPWEAPPSRKTSALANLDPDADPFASARAAEAQKRGDDPFSVGADPFEGPRQRSFVETQHDGKDEPSSNQRPTSEDALVQRAGPGLDFEIDENEDPEPMRPVSAAEVSSLIKSKRSSNDEENVLDDLDALLGDAAARTPDPGIYKIPSDAPQKKPSEALTRPVDTAKAAEALGEVSRAPTRTGMDALPPPPPAPGSARYGPRSGAQNPALRGSSGTGRVAPVPPPIASGARTQPLQAQNPTAPEAEGKPPKPAELAFEVAKLQDEVRRLRMALEAARQADPEKVRVAIEGLRTDELGRQAREIADLRAQITDLTARHEKTQAELDDVTGDMIAKEDTIDALKARVSQLEGGAPRRGPANEARAEL
jgi:pSer/pThr/pTyr-binding forkhead associated (FHA) protein